MKSLISVRQALNVALRGVTMASRFALTFILAHYLAPDRLGLYGLFGATIGLAIYAVGLEFYTYTTREILTSERIRWGWMLKNHLALSVVLYAAVMPFLVLPFVTGMLPWSVAGWLVVLLTLEHLGREVNRLLITTSQQLLASVLMFMRRGAWGWCVVVLMYLRPDTRNLTWVFSSWTVAAFAGCLLGLRRLHAMKLGGWNDKIDWHWIRRGVRVSTVFLIATLALQMLSTADTYWVAILVNRDVLGTYVLFSGLGVGMTSILDSGVFSFVYPALITAHHQGKNKQFRQEIRKMLALTVLICACFSAAILLGVSHLLVWIGKPIYLQHVNILPWVLLATFLSCISYTPHYGLYAKGQDRPIIVSHILGALIFVPAVWLVAQTTPDLAVPIGLCCSFAFILLWKTWYYLRSGNGDYRVESESVTSAHIMKYNEQEDSLNDLASTKLR